MAEEETTPETSDEEKPEETTAPEETPTDGDDKTEA